jgi:hypothetical protein
MTDKYPAFAKIPRLSRSIVISEKIDGTNGLVHVAEDGIVRAGSRNRWITPEDDNYGFAKWVETNQEELRELGPGYHYGEWFGKGIQRGYGLSKKHFALFNTYRWKDSRPECCDVVPILYEGIFSETAINEALTDLAEYGSMFNPEVEAEGIIIFHTHSGHYYKKTIKDDHKGQN